MLLIVIGFIIAELRLLTRNRFMLAYILIEFVVNDENVDRLYE